MIHWYCRGCTHRERQGNPSCSRPWKAGVAGRFARRLPPTVDTARRDELNSFQVRMSANTERTAGTAISELHRVYNTCDRRLIAHAQRCTTFEHAHKRTRTKRSRRNRVATLLETTDGRTFGVRRGSDLETIGLVATSSVDGRRKSLGGTAKPSHSSFPGSRTGRVSLPLAVRATSTIPVYHYNSVLNGE